MTIRVFALILATAALLAAAPVRAQQQEVQVALDDDGRVLVIDARLADRLNILLDRHPDLEEARLFLQLPDSTYVLEVTRTRDDRALRDRVALSGAEAAELRRLVSARIATRAPAASLDQEGRYRLLGGTALLGLAFYGWAVPEVLNVTDDQTTASLYMLTAGTSFFGPWLLTRERGVSRASADLGWWGASRGIAHGLLAHALATGEDDEPADGSGRVEEQDRRGPLATALAFSLVEGVAGYTYATSREPLPGTGAAMSKGGDLGLLHGGGLGYLLDVPDRGIIAASLAGSAGGVLAGKGIAGRRAYTPGDVGVINMTGYLGALAGLTVLDWTGLEPDGDGRPVVAGLMLGNLGGLVLGDRLVRRTDFSDGQARLVALGAVAGSAFGLGVAYLIDADIDRPTVYFTLSSAGAIGGFATVYRAVAPEAFAPGVRRGGLELELDPLGLGRLAARGGAPLPARGASVPLIRGSYRF